MEYVINVREELKMKKKIKLLFLITLLLSLVGCGKKDINAKYNIVTTNFPCYDFVRAITKDSDINVEMLLKPGTEMHDYEPTPQDIINIENSDIFVYVGGESDSWIEDILDDIDTKKTKVIKLMDYVNILVEEHVEGMEINEENDEGDEIEYDEHIWTSPKNAIILIKKLCDEIKKIDIENSDYYEENANNYIKEIETINREIEGIISSSKRKEIIFGDRFPLRYFVEQYGLSYYAAFPGCSEQTEASAKTIAFLIKKIREDNIPVVFHIELSSGKIANAISKETGAKVLEFHSIHNISQQDFSKGLTYVDFMKKNKEVLKEALN